MEIVITYNENGFHQIAFINDGIIENVEPFEKKHHNQYLNLDITIFKKL